MFENLNKYWNLFMIECLNVWTYEMFEVWMFEKWNVWMFVYLYNLNIRMFECMKC